MIGKENVVAQQLLYIPANENENHWILVIAFPNEKLSYDFLNTDFKKKGFRNIINVFSKLPRKKKSKHEFSAWKSGSLDDRKQLHTTDCGVLVRAMTTKIATKEIIFDSLTTIDLRYQIVSQCLSHNFPRSITKRIKTKFYRIMMAPRFNKQLHILQKHNMIRVSCIIVCPVVFILLCNLDRHGGLLKLMRKSQL